MLDCSLKFEENPRNVKTGREFTFERWSHEQHKTGCQAKGGYDKGQSQNIRFTCSNFEVLDPREQAACQRLNVGLAAIQKCSFEARNCKV